LWSCFHHCLKVCCAGRGTSRALVQADSWGNLVVAFDVPDAHDQLSVTGTSTVETHPAGERPRAGWEDIGDPRALDRLAELLVPTPLTALPDELAGECDRLRATADPAAATEEAVAALRQRLRYERGGTDTMTTAAGAWAAGHGVCQDFAHLTLAILRHLGIPGRYVSGYVHPLAEAAPGETVDGESHAWVEAWTGGWWGIDPANDAPAGHRHVIVARGRDYADVPPIKGVYAGPAQQQMTVTVRITRARLRWLAAAPGLTASPRAPLPFGINVFVIWCRLSLPRPAVARLSRSPTCPCRGLSLRAGRR